MPPAPLADLKSERWEVSVEAGLRTEAGPGAHHWLVVGGWWRPLHAGGDPPPVLPLHIPPGVAQRPADLLVAPAVQSDSERQPDKWPQDLQDIC